MNTQPLPHKHDRVHFWRNMAYEFPPKWRRFIGTVDSTFTTFGGDTMVEVVTDDGCWFILRQSELKPWRFSGN